MAQYARYPTAGTVTATSPSTGANGAAIPTQTTQVGGPNGSGLLTPIKLTAAQAVLVDGSASTQPVSGTVAVSNFPATQAISAAALPLPAGAATSAKQPALGTAGTPSADVLTVQGAAAGTPLNVQVGTTAGLASSPALAAQVTGYGILRTSPENTSVFYDPFDSALDTTNRWNTPTTSGTGAITQGAGGETLTGGTTASSYVTLSSQPSFVGLVPGFLQVGWALKLESGAAVTGAQRFWGQGTAPGTPTLAAPMTDGVGWEIDTNGKLAAVVYASGVRTLIQDLSSTGSNKQPTDGNYHRYAMFIRTDKCYWYIDSLDVPVATSNFQFPTIQTLPLRAQVVNGLSTLTTAATIITTGVGVGDSGRSGTQLSDSTAPWRKASVSAAGALKVDGSAVTQPISGTVTANAGTGTFTVAGTATTTGSAANAVFQAEGSVLGTALTATYATVITPSAAWKQFSIRNNTDTSVRISMDAGTTLHFVLDAGDALSIDMRADNVQVTSGTAIQARYDSVAGTKGSLRINGLS